MTTVFHAEYKGDLAPYTYELERLREAGIGFLAAVCADQAELIARAEGAEVIWLEWTPKVTRDVLEALSRCELVVRWGVGYDQIDVEAATELGVAVANAPTYCQSDVAEHTLGLVLAIARGIPLRNASLHADGWRTPAIELRRLSGRTLGVIGLGRIGRRVAELGAAFGCRVLGTDIRPVDVTVPGMSTVGLEELLAEADIVSVHTSLNPTSRSLLDERALALMKRDAILVNTSRGTVIDEPALVAALEDGRFFGVGLDVFAEEPLALDHPLRRVERVVLTPHEASFSPESVAALRREVCETTIDWVTKGWTANVVDPALAPEHTRRQRAQI